MTTPGEQGTATRAEAEEAPVWLPPGDATAGGAQDAAAGEPATDEPVAPSTAAAPALDRRRPARRATSTTVLLAISALVAIGGLSFAVGRATSTGQTGTGQTANGGVNGPGASGFGGFAPNASGAPGLGRPGVGQAAGTSTVSGTVVSVTSSSITVQLADGQTVTIAIDSSTTFHDQASAAGSDVTVGSTVTVQTSGSASASASPGTDGTRTAKDVTITGK